MLWNFWALGQLPPREIAPNPNSNANPKPNLTPIGAGGNCPNTVILICSFPKYQAIYKNSAVLCKKHAFREVSSSSKKKTFIKKRAEQSKNKECKKRSHKKSLLRKFIKYL